jgi:glycosyltransferase involved in cell wall biosynthesis
VKLIGLMRVRDEARWIARAVAAMRAACDEVLVFDDHSRDDTARLAAEAGATVIASPFPDRLDEVRDKNHLLASAQQRVEGETWMLMLDGDEVLLPNARSTIRAAIAARLSAVYSVRILYLWDREDQVRIDGIYGRFLRPSLWLHYGGNRFKSDCPGGLHCGNVPRPVNGAPPVCATALHYGYLHREDRIRKFEWYRRIDGQNRVEDGYRHMVLGDLPQHPAAMRTRWAGPLTLKALECVLANCGS